MFFPMKYQASIIVGGSYHADQPLLFPRGVRRLGGYNNEPYILLSYISWIARL